MNLDIDEVYSLHQFDHIILAINLKTSRFGWLQIVQMIFVLDSNKDNSANWDHTLFTELISLCENIKVEDLAFVSIQLFNSHTITMGHIKLTWPVGRVLNYGLQG